MHELSIAYNILEIAQSRITSDSWNGVRRIRVRVGEQSGVVSESLMFCFQAVSAETPLRSATLILDLITFVVHCPECRMDDRPNDGTVVCPKCGSCDAEIVSGTDLTVESIEVEGRPEAAR